MKLSSFVPFSSLGGAGGSGGVSRLLRLRRDSGGHDESVPVIGC